MPSCSTNTGNVAEVGLALWVASTVKNGMDLALQ
jgi:hypothetical protein